MAFGTGSAEGNGREMVLPWILRVLKLTSENNPRTLFIFPPSSPNERGKSLLFNNIKTPLRLQMWFSISERRYNLVFRGNTAVASGGFSVSGVSRKPSISDGTVVHLLRGAVRVVETSVGRTTTIGVARRSNEVNRLYEKRTHQTTATTAFVSAKRKSNKNKCVDKRGCFRLNVIENRDRHRLCLADSVIWIHALG